LRHPETFASKSSKVVSAVTIVVKLTWH